MDNLRLKLIGRQDRNKNDYYFTTTRMPVSIDLSRAVLHFFPEDFEDGGFGGELVIRFHDKPSGDPEIESEDEAPRRRRKRTRDQNQTPESDSE